MPKYRSGLPAANKNRKLNMSERNVSLILFIISLIAIFTAFAFYAAFYFTTSFLIHDSVNKTLLWSGLFDRQIRVQAEKKVNSSPAVPSGQIDTSNWKTYRNEKYGFEVKYPAELEIRSPSESPLPGELMIHIIADDYKNTEEGPAAFYEGKDEIIWKSRLSHETSYKVGDQCLEGDWGFGTYNREEINCTVFNLHPYAIKEEVPNIVELSLPTQNFDLTIEIYYRKYSDEVLQQILSTFKFIQT